MYQRVVRLVVGVGLLCFALPALAGDIHRAIEAGDVARVEQILESNPGAISQLDDSQFREPPIITAAATGNLEIARLLLDAGADIDAGDSDNSTALGVAALRRQGEMVSFLIERGADVNRRDRKADCPLSFAVYGRDEAIIQQLLDAGADLYFMSPRGETLLHIACGRGVRNLTELLLERNFPVNAQSEHGDTPLGSAAAAGHAEIVRLLLERGADPNLGRAGETSPLLGTLWRNQVECARILVENGAEVDQPVFNGNTVLLFAAERASVEMVQLFIDHGAEVNRTNDDGETALIHAAAGGHADRVEALLAAKADPNLGTDGGGRTALQLAALSGYVDVAQKLVDGGAKVNVSTAEGETPLFLARYYGNRELAALLAARGADGDTDRIDRSLGALGDVGDKGAVLWFLGHSGWAVKTRNHLLIFDYFPQEVEPAEPGFCNGCVAPGEIAGQKVAVFASHNHGDHYNPAVFEWREPVGDITYFLGLQPEDVPAYEYMPERLEKSFGDMKVTTIHSTDAGVGVVVEVDGLTIFHAGDHANGRIGLMEEFTDEIEWLAGKGLRPDICFLGIRGCSLGAPDEVKEGVYYTLKKLRPKVFIPMHAGAEGRAYREFVDECRDEFASVQMAFPENRGDHFVYKKGKIKDPRPEGLRQARAD